MSGFARRLSFAAAVVLAAACGGQSFTVTGDAAVTDGSIVMTGDGATIPIDGPSDVRADTASDALPGEDAASDGETNSDGAMVRDGGPIDAFVPDVIEEPPPHCDSGFGCVPSVPAGWSGPFELYSGSAPSPACSANFEGPAYNGNGGLAATPAACKCGCGGPLGVSCSTPPIAFYGGLLSGSTCSTANLCTEVTLQAGACEKVDVLPTCPVLTSSAEMSVAAPAPVGGMCAGIPSSSVAPYAWGVSARACVSSLAPARLDCAAGSICAPQPASPFGSALCISQPGTVPCPTAGYTNTSTFYGSVADGRGCTACTCGAVTGAACSGTVAVAPSTDGTCTGNAISYIAPFTCDAVQQPGDLRFTVTASGGSCTANPVTSTGAAVPATPTTFCCLP